MENESTILLNIKELLSQDNYVIPIYQRNYAWGEPQVKQLIQDIWDSCENKDDIDYYIGTLVVSQSKENLFEVIDGQQRHTTLSIIISVLKNVFGLNQQLNSIDGVNLKFDARKKSQNTLIALFDNGDDKKDLITNPYIYSAYKYIVKEINRLKDESIKDEIEFTKYLLEKVKILRVIVPEDTDLNHYFEIMNNRGEQLEKHEILKARFLKIFENEPENLNAFSKVWDICSRMDYYIQYGFDLKHRSPLFGNEWNDFTTENFDDVKDIIRIESEGNNETTLLSFIDPINRNGYETKIKTGNNDDNELRFNSIINFSNFLLHILRIHVANDKDFKHDISLDDKQLLVSFDEVFEYLEATNKGKRDFVKTFGFNLFKYRFLFDKFIIKRELKDEKWSLFKLNKYEKSASYINTFSNEGDNKTALMLLSMFHVSYPTLIYKHWLTGVLKYLGEQEETIIDVKMYINHLEQLSDKFYFGRFNINEQKEYYDIIFNNYTPFINEINENYLHKGTQVHNFIFNRLDYLLWKTKEGYNDFDFTFRSSVEHYFPQNPLGGEKLTKYNIDSFGNLCLISQSKNSRISNFPPHQKKEFYSKSVALESIKQRIMLDCSAWNDDNVDIIIKHEQEMIELLNSKI